jgi:hypothetical protein
MDRSKPQEVIMRRQLSYALLLLSLSFAAAADNGDELQKLYNALNMLNQQQQSIYQQFQMVQELRLSGAPRLYGPTTMYGQSPGQVANYEEVVEAQKRALMRGEYLYMQADQLLAEYNEIEGKKKPLQQRIYELTQEK